MQTEEKQKLINEGYMDGKKSFEYLSGQIMLNFRFEKVEIVMRALGWEWFLKNGGYEIPDMGRIKNSALRLLEDVYKQGKGSVSCGGFCAGWDNNELYLVFQIEEWTTND